MDNAVHVVWATGGSLVPEKVRAEYMAEAMRGQNCPAEYNIENFSEIM